MFTAYDPGARAGADAIGLAEPEISGNEWAYVKECLDSGWVSTAGSFVTRFEQEFSSRLDGLHAVATASGTAALHVALLVAGVHPGDEVLVPALTFIAPANAVRYVGAWPVFVDPEPDYWQMDPERARDFLENECVWQNGGLRNRATGRPVRAILPVHLLGHPVNMDPLMALARQYGLVVIEDATEALGAAYQGRAVGSIGDVACFSFNGNKILTTGGGGMIATRRAAWAEKARYLTTQAKDDAIAHVHKEIGFNYRLTNVQAAIGCAQLERLDAFVAAKRRIASRYATGLAGVPGIDLMREAGWATSTFWLFTVRVRESDFGTSNTALLEKLRRQGVQARPLWQPLHRSPAHAACQPRDCPVADRIHREALSLPSSVGLTTDAQARVIAAICSCDSV